MNILDRIVSRKKEEVTEAALKVSIRELERSPLFGREPLSLKTFLLNPEKNGIIAEFKRKSPSKGWIHEQAAVTTITQAYASAGVSALSVLTDHDFFGGTLADLSAAREVNELPVLRKDFIIDPYQVIEAKAGGADVILLIAAILSPQEIISLSALAQSLGLSVLLEVHQLDELQRSLCETIDAVGVNNRNLADFKVDVETSFSLADHIPGQFLKVSESGIDDPQLIKDLRKAGFSGFLIGEHFMKNEDPGLAVRNFVYL